jgi:hypothetical protein
LPDDDPISERYRDTRNFKRDSPWNGWNISTEDPTISVLVLELLGECCSEHWDECEGPRKGLRCISSSVLANCPFREDIIAVLEDVGAYGLIHVDVTALDFLCFKGGDTPEARCPRHNVVHGSLTSIALSRWTWRMGITEPRPFRISIIYTISDLQRHFGVIAYNVI